MEKKIRTLAIALLDDENGINSEGYEALASLLHETNNTDILDAVEAQGGRYFIYENDAETLKQK